MSILSRILPPKLFSFQRMVDAAAPLTKERPYIVVAAADSRTDVSFGDRNRLVALSRKLWYNNSVIKGAIMDLALYSIGDGIRPQARTESDDFNDAAEAYWKEWCKIPEITGRMDMATIQKIVSETIDRDGEIFCILTESNDGYPQLQLIETHRVATPPALQQDKNIVDGVKLSSLGRPVKYYILTGGDGTSFTTVQAEDMIHITELERADQIRGFPRTAVAINDLADRDDLRRFEISSAKINAALGLVISNKTGSVSDGFLGDTNSSSDGKITVEDIFGGGMIPRVKTGESVDSFRSDRPNNNLIPFTDALIRSASVGLGLPYEFCYDASQLAGTAQRFVMAKAARRFEQRQATIINRFLNRTWRYVIAKAIKRGEIQNAPQDWWPVVWQTPRKITVDNGRDSTQDREDYKIGFRSISDICGERGDDWQEVITQKIRELSWVKKQAETAGIPVELIQVIATHSGAPIVTPQYTDSTDGGQGSGVSAPVDATPQP